MQPRQTRSTSGSTERGGETGWGLGLEEWSSDSEVSLVVRNKKAKSEPFDSVQPTGLLKKPITT